MTEHEFKALVADYERGSKYPASFSRFRCPKTGNQISFVFFVEKPVSKDLLTLVTRLIRATMAFVPGLDAKEREYEQAYTDFSNAATFVWRSNVGLEKSPGMSYIDVSFTIDLRDPCVHVWKSYVGIIESYDYCTSCDEKRR